MRWIVILLLLLTAACAAPVGDDGTVSGPSWRTDPRRGEGAATAQQPATITAVRVSEHEHFDRVSFRFDGELPGYRVAYWPQAPGGLTVRITLEHATAAQRRTLTPELTVVSSVDQRAGSAAVVETTVAVRAGQRLPFRVGLGIGEFSVDLAHPDQAARG